MKKRRFSEIFAYFYKKSKIMKRCIFIIIAIVMVTVNLNAQNNPNVYTYKVPVGEFILLSEGQGSGGPNLLVGATPDMLAKTIPGGTFPNATNAFLVKIQGFNILIDAGHGRELFNNLKSVGVAPENIDIVLITHMHGDHIGGMLIDGKPAFPNAMVYIPKPEHDYWMSQQGGGAQGAQNVIAAYKGRIELFVPAPVGEEDGGIISAGIFPMQAYGHTPGHTAFLLSDGSSRVLVWGDLTHAMAVQMPYPQVALTYDVNPTDAIAARKQVIEYAVKNNIPVAGMHVPYPGMGTITALPAGGYQFTPMK